MRSVLSFCFLIFFLVKGMAQLTGCELNFNQNNWVPAWSHASFSISNLNGILNIQANSVGGSYENFVGALPNMNLVPNPHVWIRLQTQYRLKFELRLLDINGIETNFQNPIMIIDPLSEYTWIKLDFTGRFRQSWPVSAVVDSQNISKMSILFNSGGNPDYTGWVKIDNIIFGDSSGTNSVDPIQYIPKVNQVGYLPHAKKVAVLPVSSQVSFRIVDAISQQQVWSGVSSAPMTWNYSGEKVALADFSDFTTPGTYCLIADSLPKSSVNFEIAEHVFDALLNAGLKSFYFQRASTAIESPYAGVWSRATGHPDTAVLIHASAASMERPKGTYVKASRGWYDAGDFGKYVVPAGITIGQLLNAYSLDSMYYKNVSSDIPESENLSADLLDEVQWELDWLLAMQDTTDGGVYHKLTTASFGGTMLPAQDLQPRYLTQKSTAAGFVFAATFATTARYYPENEMHYIARAEMAWQWAKLNPGIVYDQNSLNALYDPDIVTGDYGVQSGNTNLSDEQLWAAVALYAATGKAEYLVEIDLTGFVLELPSWSSSKASAILSLIREPNIPLPMQQRAQNILMTMADQLVGQQRNSAYGISMGGRSWDFSWNSNASAANQAGILAQAFLLTGNERYLDAAGADLDYLLGRNPLNRCFVTGFGSNPPRYIHHRISAADTVQAPVPGFLINGPHNNFLSECVYTSSLPALAYTDEYCSSATNEVAIYVNSALVYALTGLRCAYQLKSGLENVSTSALAEILVIAPNPTERILRIQFTNVLDEAEWQIVDCRGERIDHGKMNAQNELQISIEQMPGVYHFILTSTEGRLKKSFVVY